MELGPTMLYIPVFPGFVCKPFRVAAYESFIETATLYTGNLGIIRKRIRCHWMNCVILLDGSLHVV
jgi:hypothetical protein